jgi:hypothetical protein
LRPLPDIVDKDQETAANWRLAPDGDYRFELAAAYAAW